MFLTFDPANSSAMNSPRYPKESARDTHQCVCTRMLTVAFFSYPKPWSPKSHKYRTS